MSRPRPFRRAPLAVALAALLNVHAAGAADAAGAPDVESPDAGSRPPARKTAECKPTELDRGEVVGATGLYEVGDTRSATKTDTPLQDVPQAITVVNSQMIRDQRMQGLSDVLRYVPGATMAQGEGNRDTPILRGSSSTADMFVDGMRDDTQYFRDLYNIDRVEALKGPNAMVFGRGGSGGVLNRVSKEADGSVVRGFDLTWGSNGRSRGTADWGDALGQDLSFRVNALAEESGSYRDGVEQSRRGFNPTLAWRAGGATSLSVGYERFEDRRTADRGVPSFGGRPVDVDPSTFFGNADASRATVDVDAASLLVDHDFGDGLTLRNRTRAARYDKFYQNVYPGAVSASGMLVAISAYNNATRRTNLFNQTDLVWELQAGSWSHTLLGGFEFGRQVTDNHRETGYFDSGACAPSSAGPTSVAVPLADPVYTGLTCFRPSATDADNHGVARVAAAYVQDQIQFSPQWLAVLGLRYDRFAVDVHNNRNGQDLAATDGLLSPRVGLVWKPAPEASVYANFSVAYLPRSGDQLSSLSPSNEALDPEEFRNLELGAKWQLTPGLAATAALYRLDRANVAIVDEANPAQLVLLPGKAQRVQGLELGLSGDIGERWHVFGGYAWQKGEILRDIRTSPTAMLTKGTELPQVPRHGLSLWNRVDIGERWGAGLGLLARSRSYASTSNAVVLPGYVRADAAVYYALSPRVALQLNIENLFDLRYFGTANNDNNITPGSPRAFSLGLNLDL
jgi:catecholate siderophore receptor